MLIKNKIIPPRYYHQAIFIYFDYSGHDGSLVKDFFLRTPPMSMNSLALVISDYRLITTLHSPGKYGNLRYHQN